MSVDQLARIVFLNNFNWGIASYNQFERLSKA
ncbi:uncharacterized protein METZ01_LOCUS309745, partial [marine metagenome]